MRFRLIVVLYTAVLSVSTVISADEPVSTDRFAASPPAAEVVREYESDLAAEQAKFDKELAELREKCARRMASRHEKMVADLDQIARVEGQTGDEEAVVQIRGYLATTPAQGPLMPESATPTSAEPWRVYLADAHATTFDAPHLFVPLVDGEPSPRHIAMHPHRNGQASAVYEVPAAAGVLVGNVTLSDTVAKSAAPLYFRIRDETGKELWASRPVLTRKHTQPFRVALGAATSVKLEVSSASFDYAHAVWVEPRFEK